MNAYEKILIPLDVDSGDAAVALARRLAGRVGGFKVGLELVNAAGFDIFDRLTDAGVDRIFYDAKFHDIPNTVQGAVRAVAKRGVWMVNVHASGGAAMMAAARDATQVAARPPLLIGVTVLTSIGQRTLNDELRVPGEVEAQVVHLARLAQSTGLDGVVCSPHEVATLKLVCGAEFLTVVPGIRPAGVATHDQQRVATPATAVKDGADYLVIGRAITGADDPSAAADAIVRQIEEAGA